MFRGFKIFMMDSTSPFISTTIVGLICGYSFFLWLLSQSSCCYPLLHLLLREEELLSWGILRFVAAFVWPYTQLLYTTNFIADIPTVATLFFYGGFTFGRLYAGFLVVFLSYALALFVGLMNWLFGKSMRRSAPPPPPVPLSVIICDAYCKDDQLSKDINSSDDVSRKDVLGAGAMWEWFVLLL